MNILDNVTGDNKTVVVGMSGGVDSSVAAALLVEQGYQVIGMMLRLWSDPGRENENKCCTPDSMAQARRVAAQLGIPFYTIDVQEYFEQVIVQSFIEGYTRGITPNPCIRCNQEIRWGFLLEKALGIGADYFATGHYARIVENGDGNVSLCRGRDQQKDQSYVLSGLSQNQLQHTLLPLGELTKVEVREIARKYNFRVADRPDSQDLCFLAGEDYRTFIKRHRANEISSGKIVRRDGTIVGEHSGLFNYTIGQRRGLNISSEVPLYVIEKDIEKNVLVVGTSSELGSDELLAGKINFINQANIENDTDYEIKIRYKAEPALGKLFKIDNNQLRIKFNKLLRDITPGQLVVIYNGDQVVASGEIISS